MSHFAEIDENGKVLRVIVAEQDFIDSGLVGSPDKWVQASYNTKEGFHDLGGIPLRKNYPSAGYTYDKTLDAFLPPKPFNSWTLNETKGSWLPPKVPPTEGKAIWDETKQDWTTLETNPDGLLQP